MAYTRSQKPRPRKPKGRPRKPAPVTGRQLEYLRSLAGVDSALVAFLAYVYRLQTAPVGDGPPGERYVPVPGPTIKKLFKGADWERLTRGGGAPPTLEIGAQTELPPDPVLDLDLKDYFRGLRCRHFKLRGDVVRALHERRPLTVADAEAAEWRHPKTGRRDRQPATSSEWKGRHLLPDVVRGALSALEFGEFDVAAVERWLRDQRDVRDSLPEGEDRDRVAGRVLSGEACYATVLRQFAGHVCGRGTAFYRLAYHVGTSGRLFQYGGGLQGAPGAMKAAAYFGVRGAQNYDLRASQLAVFRELADEDGVDTPAAGALLVGNFEGVAARCGVSRKAVKRAVYALLNGASFPSPSIALNALRDGIAVLPHGLALSGVVGAVAAEVVGAREFERRTREVLARGPIVVVGVSPERGVRPHDVPPRSGPLLSEAEGHLFEPLYTALHGALAPVAVEAQAWHAVLGDEERHRDHPDEGRRARDGRGGLHLPNRCGMRLNIKPVGEDGTRELVRTSKISAHLLQGVESAFVHALTARLAARGVRALSNEHDGLVVVGEVTPDDVRAARDESGYRSADLVPKPFEDDDPTEDGAGEDPLAPDPGAVWR